MTTEEEMQEELSQIVNDLKENPMLGLFQAGNELVHSNLLAWILEYNNDQVISQKLKSHLSIPQEHRIKKVFREKYNFDILIVHGPDEQVENSDNIGFVVIENKFKSLPTIGQLEKYTKEINSNTLSPYKKTKLNSQNTEKVLFAPQIFLDTFSKEIERASWSSWSYEDYLEIIKIYIQNQGPEAVVFSKYVEMTQTILDIGNRYIKADREKNLCSPNKDNIKKLEEIRLDSLYQKIWYSCVMEEMNILEFREFPEFRYVTEFTHNEGVWSWKSTTNRNGVMACLQIQAKNVRIALEPFYQDGEKIPAPKTRENQDQKELCSNVFNWCAPIIKSIANKYSSAFTNTGIEKWWDGEELKSLDTLWEGKSIDFTKKTGGSKPQWDPLYHFGDFIYLQLKLKENCTRNTLKKIIIFALKEIQRNLEKIAIVKF